MRGFVDAVWRTDCMCCGRVVDRADEAGAAVGRELCTACAGELVAPWQRWEPTTGAVVPVFTAGAYGGARRALIIAAKERLRPAAVEVGGRVLAAGIQAVAGRGLISDPRLSEVCVVPAPTRRSAARARGGDVMEGMARAAAGIYPRLRVTPALWLGEDSRDSVGLGRSQRRENVAAAVRVDAQSVEALRRAHPAHVVLADDVCTTGATLAQSALALAAHGVRVDAAVVLAAA